MGRHFKNLVFSAAYIQASLNTIDSKIKEASTENGKNIVIIYEYFDKLLMLD